MAHYGIIGHPVAHSRSAVYFSDLFVRLGIDADYTKFDLLSASEIPEILHRPGMCGLNVTLPHKIAVMEYLDELAESAKQVGAVNVVKISRSADGIKAVGYNTDMTGFRDSIAQHLGQRKKALVFGTGGAAKAVVAALDELGVSHTTVSRTPAAGQLAYSQVTEYIIAATPILINATPMGMTGALEDKYPDIPYNAVTKQHLAYDLVYTPDPTRFLQLASERGAETVSGNDMFLKQAQATWRIWQNNETEQ